MHTHADNASSRCRPALGRPGGREMADGARAMAPTMVGYPPFGLLLGTAVARCANP